MHGRVEAPKLEHGDAQGWHGGALVQVESMDPAKSGDRTRHPGLSPASPHPCFLPRTQELRGVGGADGDDGWWGDAPQPTGPAGLRRGRAGEERDLRRRLCCPQPPFDQQPHSQRGRVSSQAGLPLPPRGCSSRSPELGVGSGAALAAGQSWSDGLDGTGVLARVHCGISPPSLEVQLVSNH